MTDFVHIFVSSFKDRTFDICAPKFLCLPEHDSHKNIPKLIDAHSTLFASHSIHVSLPGIRSKSCTPGGRSSYSHTIVWSMRVAIICFKCRDM